MTSRRGTFCLVMVGFIVCVLGLLCPWSDCADQVVASGPRKRVALSDKDRIELRISRLEQSIRGSDVHAVAEFFGMAGGSGGAKALPKDSSSFSALETLLASCMEDPREKPIVDLAVTTVRVAGGTATAEVKARVARKAGSNCWEVEEYDIEVQFLKSGRAWQASGCQEAMRLLAVRKHAVDSAAGSTGIVGR